MTVSVVKDDEKQKLINFLKDTIELINDGPLKTQLTSALIALIFQEYADKQRAKHLQQAQEGLG